MKTRFAYFALLAVLAACQVPWNAEPAKPQAAAAVTFTVGVRTDTRSFTARPEWPGAPTYYNFTLVDASDNVAAESLLQGASSWSPTVNPGSYTLLAAALDEMGQEYAWADEPITVFSGMGPVSLVLRPSLTSENGQAGPLTLSYSWPKGAPVDPAASTLSLTPLVPGQATVPGPEHLALAGELTWSYDGPDAVGLSFARTGLSTGPYLAILTLKDGSAKTRLTLSGAVHAYRNRPLTYPHPTLDIKAFDAPPTPVSDIRMSYSFISPIETSDTVVLTWDGGQTAESYGIEYRTLVGYDPNQPGELTSQAWTAFGNPGGRTFTAGSLMVSLTASEVAHQFRIRAENQFGQAAWVESPVLFKTDKSALSQVLNDFAARSLPEGSALGAYDFGAADARSALLEGTLWPLAEDTTRTAAQTEGDLTALRNQVLGFESNWRVLFQNALPSQTTPSTLDQTYFSHRSLLGEAGNSIPTSEQEVRAWARAGNTVYLAQEGWGLRRTADLAQLTASYGYLAGTPNWQEGQLALDVDVSPDGQLIAAATNLGLMLSSDAGATWEFKHELEGIYADPVYKVSVHDTGSFKTLATSGLTNGLGELLLSYSLNNGLNWTHFDRTTLQNRFEIEIPSLWDPLTDELESIIDLALDSNRLYVAFQKFGGLQFIVYYDLTTEVWMLAPQAPGGSIYKLETFEGFQMVASDNGLSYSTDGFQLLTNSFGATTAQGLGHTRVYDFSLEGSNLHVATASGLSIVTDFPSTPALFGSYTPSFTTLSPTVGRDIWLAVASPLGPVFFQQWDAGLYRYWQGVNPDFTELSRNDLFSLRSGTNEVRTPDLTKPRLAGGQLWFAKNSGDPSTTGLTLGADFPMNHGLGTSWGTWSENDIFSNTVGAGVTALALAEGKVYAGFGQGNGSFSPMGFYRLESGVWTKMLGGPGAALSGLSSPDIVAVSQNGNTVAVLGRTESFETEVVLYDPGSDTVLFDPLFVAADPRDVWHQGSEVWLALGNYTLRRYDLAQGPSPEPTPVSALESFNVAFDKVHGAGSVRTAAFYPDFSTDPLVAVDWDDTGDWKIYYQAEFAGAPSSVKALWALEQKVVFVGTDNGLFVLQPGRLPVAAGDFDSAFADPITDIWSSGSELLVIAGNRLERRLLNLLIP